MVQLLRRRAPLLAVAAALLLPASASAATLQLSSATIDDGKDPHVSTTLVVQGEGQDADDITVTRTPAAIDVVDATARVVPLPECAALSEHEATCPARYAGVAVQGGDGDDHLRNGGGLALSISGGAGDDVVDGGPDVDFIDGGPGRDTVHAGAGDQVTIDATGGLQGDVVDGGGPGGTVRLYLTTPDPGVVVDLAAGTITGPGVPDTLVGVRDVWQSGAAPATLLGDERTNQLVGNGTLDGRGGDDALSSYGRPSRLSGGPGDDGLDVGPGDVADGGPGNDQISATPYTGFSGRPATVTCGPGTDTWIAPIGLTPMPADCERVPIAGSWVLRSPQRAKHGIVVAIKMDIDPRTACGYVVWALSPKTHKRVTPLVRGRLSRAMSVQTIRLPVTTATTEIAAVAARSCPRHGTWRTYKASSALVAVRGR
jgi:hypothetical protein